ncbi:MAG: hypothetical protein K2L77_08200, partial [Muribaculaceae bacterium]|nr:hypothetical protein [Muribaculaceae bacterium]
ILLAGGDSKEDIISDGMATVLDEDGLIEVNPACFGWDDDEKFGYSWNSNPTAIIQFYEGATLERSALKSVNRRQKAVDTFKVVNMKRNLGFRKL